MRLKESINQNQINLLKATYGDIKKINPNSPAVKKLMMALKKLSKDDLETLSKAKINFVSTMAQSILRDSNVSESADIDNLQKRKNDLLKQVDPLIAKKKKLYSDVDITTPKSSDEKKLDKEIADLFSEINDLVHKIVKLKKSQNEGKHTMKLKSVNEDVNFRDGKYRFYSKQGVGYLTYDGREISSGDFDWEDGSNSYWMYHSSWRGQKAFDTGKDVIAYFKSKKITTESVNEAKYPTDLKIGSVILGQGFTMLKGIDGGKYYKVIAMDDISATLVPSDKNGNVKGSKKVRHKLDSIEGGIKTAKRGDENGIVVIKESAKKSTFIKVARISNNGKLDIY